MPIKSKLYAVLEDSVFCCTQCELLFAPNIKDSTVCRFFLFFFWPKPFFSAELLNYLRRNVERRWLQNLNTATGVTECGHQPAVILVKLMFCRGGVQHFLLRRTLYPVFHSQWSCVSFPSARLCRHNLVTVCETESKETQYVWQKLNMSK